MTIQQDRNGKWWVHLDGDPHFDADRIGHCSGGVWLYDGAPCDSIVGPYDSEAAARACAAAVVDADDA